MRLGDSYPPLQPTALFIGKWSPFFCPCVMCQQLNLCLLQDQSDLKKLLVGRPSRRHDSISCMWIKNVRWQMGV